MDKILRALLSKAYKLDAGQLEELDKLSGDDLENKIIDLDKARITELSKPKAGQTFQDGYAKGKKESLTTLETEIKAKFGVETDVTGLELIDAIVEEKTKGAGKPKEITDDDVKKHPIYVNMEKGLKKQVLDTKTEYEGKLTTKDAEFKKTATLGEVQNKAWAIVEGLKPVVPQKPEVAQTIKKSFLNSLGNYDYEVTDGNIVIMKDGKVVDDGHGHNLTFDELVKNSSSSYYEFQNNNGGGNGGNNEQQRQNNNGGAYPTGVTKPKTIAELAKLMDDPAVKLEDKTVIMDVWEKDNSVL